MSPKRITFLSILILLIGLLVNCQAVNGRSAPAADFSAEVANDWFSLQLKLIQETAGFTPPVASRALGYSGLTLYEAVIHGMPDHNSLVGQLNDLSQLPQPETNRRYHWPSAANAALATITRALYPTATDTNLAAIDALEGRYAAQFASESDAATIERSTAYGTALAQAVFEYSETDGGHEGYARNFPDVYEPPVGDGMWVATAPDFQRALQPYWGDNRPFVLESGAHCLPDPPTAFSTDPDSTFYAESWEVYTAVQNLTPEQEMIALFWADDPGKTATPPGHSISIANQILREQAAMLDVAAETYARLGIALTDAFIGCWHAKYEYDLIRPITYIQTYIDPTWNTPNITDPVITPPFPEYPSGHSTQSGATTAVLTALFGEDFAFTDHTHAAIGLPARSFASFDEAADEAAISRLYGGIHYRPAIELGVVQGRCIGEQVNGLAWKK